MEPTVSLGLQRGLRLLEMLSAVEGGLTFGEICAALQLNNNSCTRLLQGLLALGYLSHEQDRYACGPACERLRPPTDAHERMRRIVAPILEEVVRRAGSSAACFVPDPMGLLVLDARLHPDSLTMHPAGHRAGNVRQNPWGWILAGAAFWRRATPENDPRRTQTGGPVVPLTMIRNALRQVGQIGWCSHRQGARFRVAAVVSDIDQPLAVLGIATPSDDVTDNGLALGDLLHHHAHRLHRLLA